MHGSPVDFDRLDDQREVIVQPFLRQHQISFIDHDHAVVGVEIVFYITSYLTISPSLA